MKCLAIQTSPNKDGLTANLAQKVLDGFNVGEGDVEVLHLNHMDIKPCKICERGWGDCRGGKCILVDDFQDIREVGIFDNKDDLGEKMLREAWAQPGSLKAGCAYYKAAYDPPPRGTGVDEWKDGKIKVPTLVIHGMQDHAMLPQILDPLDEYVEDLKIVRSENSSHWILDDAPDVVIKEIRQFVKK